MHRYTAPKATSESQAH